MRNLSLPKQSASLQRNVFILKLLNRNDGSLHNDEIREFVCDKFLINSSKDSSMLGKQDELSRYFGLIHYDTQSKIKYLTEFGRLFLSSQNLEDKGRVILNYILDSNSHFGINNSAVPRSQSNLQPPVIFLRLIDELKYICMKEFAFTLKNNFDLDTAVHDIKNYRAKQKETEPLKFLKKFSSSTFPAFLEKLKIIKSQKKIGSQTKQYFFNSTMDSETLNRLRKTACQI